MMHPPGGALPGSNPNSDYLIAIEYKGSLIHQRVPRVEPLDPSSHLTQASSFSDDQPSSSHAADSRSAFMDPIAIPRSLIAGLTSFPAHGQGYQKAQSRSFPSYKTLILHQLHLLNLPT
ncbi:hypothetical protein Droror1_Dr00025808 [Drosera rotundifolia]